MNADTTTVRGRAGETRALDYLRRQGLTLVCRNYRCRTGEIDLVLRDGAELVFVEVRSRAGAGAGRFGTPADSVDARKRRRVAAAAQRYLLGLDREPPCRFDVVAVTGGDVEWIRDAFSL